MGKKEIRQNKLLRLILEQGKIPTQAELAEQFGVTDRTIHSDLKEIQGEIPKAAVDDIQQLLMLRLRKRVPEMRDGDLLKLAEFFLSKKTEVKEHIDASITIKSFDLGNKHADGDNDSVPATQEASTVPS